MFDFEVSNLAEVVEMCLSYSRLSQSSRFVVSILLQAYHFQMSIDFTLFTGDILQDENVRINEIPGFLYQT